MAERIEKWEFPDDLAYTPEHVWVRVEGDTATVGLSALGQELSGQIVFVEAPRGRRRGRRTAGRTVHVHGVGQVGLRRVKSPVTGTVSSANEELEWESAAVKRRPLRQGLDREAHPRGCARPLGSAEVRHARLRGPHRGRAPEVRQVGARP